MPLHIFKNDIHLKERKSIARRIRAKHLIDQSFRNKVIKQIFITKMTEEIFFSLSIRQFHWLMTRSMASSDYQRRHRQMISENQQWISTLPAQQSSRGQKRELYFFMTLISSIQMSLIANFLVSRLTYSALWTLLPSSAFTNGMKTG